jgi:hypothetical protein
MGIVCAQRPKTALIAAVSVLSLACVRMPWALLASSARASRPAERSAATRAETDAFGPIQVPEDALWAAQTERSRRFFAIGRQRMPLEVVHALTDIERAAAEVNRELGPLDSNNAQTIANTAARVAAGECHDQFPLSVRQAVSGRQSQMNVNEFVARLASRALGAGAGVGGARSMRPNDDVNPGQSSRDVSPPPCRWVGRRTTTPRRCDPPRAPAHRESPPRAEVLIHGAP